MEPTGLDLDLTLGGVPIRRDPSPRDGDSFKLTVGSGTAESGYQRDIWVDRPGPSPRAAPRLNAMFSWLPDSGGGTYKLKTQLQRISTGDPSGFSPVVSITR